MLKGALLRFLASLALEGMGVPKIWIALISHSVLTENLSGKLMGIQVNFNSLCFLIFNFIEIFFLIF